MWGVLVKISKWLSPERILVIKSWWPWGEHIHLENDGVDEGATDSYARLVGRHRSNVSRQVNSSDVWGFVTMVFHLVELIGHLENWFRACPCHSRALLADMFPHNWSCILEGCRAVCCATGEMDRMLRDIISSREHLLSQQLPVDMSEASCSKVVRQFQRCKSIIFTHAVLRFKEWKDLPLSLFGIGHHDPELALQYLAKCFIQCHAAIADNRRARLHDSVIEMFEAEPGRTEVLTALRTGQLMDVGYLAEWRAKCQFVRCCEVSVERLHATLTSETRGIGNLGYAQLSSRSRRLEFADRCKDTVARAAITSLLDFTYSPAKCIQALGMSGHVDSVAYMLDGKCPDHFPASTAARIIYRGDLHTQF